MSNIKLERRLRNFAEGYYTLPQTGTQQHPYYNLTRDGFFLLAMGFTGKKALQFKLAYIDAFNRMEAQLQEQQRAIVMQEAAWSAEDVARRYALSLLDKCPEAKMDEVVYAMLKLLLHG